MNIQTPPGSTPATSSAAHISGVVDKATAEPILQRKVHKSVVTEVPDDPVEVNPGDFSSPAMAFMVHEAAADKIFTLPSQLQRLIELNVTTKNASEALRAHPEARNINVSAAGSALKVYVYPSRTSDFCGLDIRAPNGKRLDIIPDRDNPSRYVVFGSEDFAKFSDSSTGFKQIDRTRPIAFIQKGDNKISFVSARDATSAQPLLHAMRVAAPAPGDQTPPAALQSKVKPALTTDTSTAGPLPQENPMVVSGHQPAVSPLIEQLDHRDFLCSTDVSEAIGQRVADASQHARMADILNRNPQQTLAFVKNLQEIMSGVRGLSSSGLQATFRKAVINNPAFQALMSDKHNLRIFAALSVMANLPAEQQDQWLPQELREELNKPLFQDRNRYTDTDFVGTFAGIKVSRDGMVFPQNGRNNLLTELLSNCPFESLQTQANGFSRENILSAQAVATNIGFYKQLNQNLREVMDMKPMDSVERRFMQEPYEPGKWGEYKDRLLKLGEICRTAKYGVTDRSAATQLLPITQLTAKEIISGNLLMSEKLAHFALDPKHLANILTSNANYQIFQPTLMDMVDEITQYPTASENHEIAGKQLFTRMKLLQYQLYLETQNGNPAFADPQLVQDLYKVSHVNHQS